MRGSAAQKQCGRDDQRERNFKNEFCARAGGTLNFDFTVQRIQVGPDDVKADAAAREFGFHRGGGKARAEKHVA